MVWINVEMHEAQEVRYPVMKDTVSVIIWVDCKLASLQSQEENSYKKFHYHVYAVLHCLSIKNVSDVSFGLEKM